MELRIGLLKIIKRIYNKVLHIIDFLIELIYKQIQSLKIIKPIEVSFIGSKNDVLHIEHPYPVNFKESDKKLFEEWKQYNTFENKIFVLDDVTVSFEGVVLKNNQCFVPALPHPIFKAKFGFRFSIYQKLFIKKVLLSDSEKYLLIYDFWSIANYYHWMVDSLCRLEEWKSVLVEYTLIIPENAPKYILETLAYFNFKGVTLIKKNTSLKVPHIYIPNYCAWSGQQHPLVLKKVKEVILTNISNSLYNDRIYISRSKQKCRKIVNEQEVVSMLTSYNFQTIYFEGMSVSQQISIVKNAKIFITSHGANVVNALFGKNIKVLELIRNDKPNFCYWSMFSNVDIPYYYQLCKVMNHDDLLVNMNLLNQNLKLLLNE